MTVTVDIVPRVWLMGTVLCSSIINQTLKLLTDDELMLNVLRCHETY